jgi:hypothetical protein
MPWTRVFISHSTRTARGREFLEAIQARLRDDFNVDLDQTGLQAGDDWREKIYRWMDQAHAAVLVLTPEALQSRFVAIEASVLGWRAFRHPDFLLIPVLVDVDPAELRQGFAGELDLQRVQAVCAGTPDEAARKVLERLAPLAALDRPRTPRELLEATVTKALRHTSVEQVDLRETGVLYLGWNPDGLGADADLAREYAGGLLRAGAVQAYRAVKALAKRGVKTAPELLDLVAPIWVQEDRALPIAYQARAAPDRRVLVLDLLGGGEDDAREWTVVSYLSRAYYRGLGDPVRTLELSPPGEEGTVEYLTARILEAFRPRSRFGTAATPDRIKELIAQRETTAEPVFAIFKSWVPDAGTLRELRKEFSTITFFVLGGGCPSQRLQALCGPGHLLDAVDFPAEKDAFLEYSNTYDDLQPADGQGAR